MKYILQSNLAGADTGFKKKRKKGEVGGGGVVWVTVKYYNVVHSCARA